MVRPQSSAPAVKKRAHPESYQITYPLGLSMTPSKLRQWWASQPEGPQEVVFFFDEATTAPYLYRLSNWFISTTFSFDVPEICNADWLRLQGMHTQVSITCGEQALMLCKAALMKDLNTFQRILDAKSPRAFKALGRQVAPFNEALWLQRVCAISLAVVRGRVSQDAGLKHLVSSLAGSYVAEASPTDRLHGIGMPADDPNALCPTLWQGANVLGWAYMTVSQEMAGYKRRDSSNADGASECYHCDGGWFKGEPCWFCQEGLLEDDEEEEGGGGGGVEEFIDKTCK